jgi:transposase-like protein
VPKLSANEQQMLDTVKKKIQAINTDVLNSKGLTQAEAQLAAKVGIIDPDQIWFWLENWQEGHREAERDILEGRKSGPFETADELFAHLQKQTV